MVNLKGFNPETGEWNDTLTVDFIWGNTSIGRTLIFPRLAVVVTDVGAPLSHAAIVARKLGIPAVIGCGHATAHLNTGDRVRVDGSTGTVTRINSAK